MQEHTKFFQLKKCNVPDAYRILSNLLCTGDQNSHTTAVTSPPEVDRPSQIEAPPTDIFSTDYLTPVAADSNYEDEEHIYHELHNIYDTFKATCMYFLVFVYCINYFLLSLHNARTQTRFLID